MANATRQGEQLMAGLQALQARSSASATCAARA